jgi:hypothetical protein
MITVKILLNSVISTQNARFMTIDIKDFYLNTPMERPEFMRLKLSDIPNNIIELYKLRDIAHDGYVFVHIQKGMYGLPQAGIIAQQLLEQRLQANGYHQSKINPVSGCTTGAQFVLHSVWTTLASNMAEKNMLTISSKHYRGIMRYPWTGMDGAILGLPCNGTTRTAVSTSQCPAIVKKLDSASNTPNLTNRNINHIPAPHAPMATYNSFVPEPTHHRHWANNKKRSYRK